IPGAASEGRAPRLVARRRQSARRSPRDRRGIPLVARARERLARRPRGLGRWSLLVMAAGQGSLEGQAPPRSPSGPPPSSATVTAGARYGAGWVHQVLLGGHHRGLWATPNRVEVLDLARLGGGLRAPKRRRRG